jgi:hypothetical protein
VEAGQLVNSGTNQLYLWRKAPFDARFGDRDLRSRDLTILFPPDVDWKRPFYAYFNHEFILSGSLRVQSLTGFLAL